VIAFENRLQERDRDSRFIRRLDCLDELDDDPCFRDGGDARTPFAASTVKNDHVRASTQAQNSRCVLRFIVGQHDLVG
jgi:hypothetical protein